jgi:predicted nucleic acid-binding Zn ribbon protein
MLAGHFHRTRKPEFFSENCWESLEIAERKRRLWIIILSIFALIGVVVIVASVWLRASYPSWRYYDALGALLIWPLTLLLLATKNSPKVGGQIKFDDDYLFLTPTWRKR